MSTKRAVITGVGVVSPAGRNLDVFFDNVISGKGFLKEIDRFDASDYPSRHAGIIEHLDSEETFSKRMLKKLDRFSHMALLAADDAINDSGMTWAQRTRSASGSSWGMHWAAGHLQKKN
jgi:3-oxoacyl-[acyl-carrier-protein] synthase II